jgi:hypothetical protein
METSIRISKQIDLERALPPWVPQEGVCIPDNLRSMGCLLQTMLAGCGP